MSTTYPVIPAAAARALVNQDQYLDLYRQYNTAEYRQRLDEIIGKARGGLSFSKDPGPPKKREKEVFFFKKKKTKPKNPSSPRGGVGGGGGGEKKNKMGGGGNKKKKEEKKKKRPRTIYNL